MVESARPGLDVSGVRRGDCPMRGGVTSPALQLTDQNNRGQVWPRAAPAAPHCHTGRAGRGVTGRTRGETLQWVERDSPSQSCHQLTLLVTHVGLTLSPPACPASLSLLHQSDSIKVELCPLQSDTTEILQVSPVSKLVCGDIRVSTVHTSLHVSC